MMPKIDRRTFLASTVAVGAGASALTACSSEGGEAPGVEDDSQPKNLRLAWWGNEYYHSTTYDAVELYESRNDLVTIETEAGSWDDFWDRLATQIAGRNGPDLIQMSNQMIVDYASREALLDFTPYMDDVIDISSWPEVLQGYGIVDGRRVGIPMSTDAFMALYDVEILDGLGIEIPEDGWTWDEVAELAGDISDRIGPDKWAISDHSRQYESLEIWVRGRGKSWFDTTGESVTLGFDKDDLADFFQWWADRREDGSCVPADYTAESTGMEHSPFVTGLAPIVFSTSSELASWRSVMTRQCQPIPMPEQTGGSVPANFVRPNLFLSSWEGTKFPLESARFIDFWVNDPEAALKVRYSRGVPPNPESARLVAEDENVEGLRSPADYVDLIHEIGSPMNDLTPAGGRECYQLLIRASESIKFGESSIGDAVQSFFDEASTLIA